MPIIENILLKKFRKVIMSPLGELTHDTRIIGDKVKYRIYLPSIKNNLVDSIVITDKLDESLSQIKVFQRGSYDPERHLVEWRFKRQMPFRTSYVEFEAVLNECKVIENQAYLELSELKPISTNIVKINVNAAPPEGWIALTADAQPGEPPRIYMKDETTMCTTVRFDIPGIFVYKENVNGVSYHQINIPGRSKLTELGKPELPILGEIVEVPFGVSFDPEIIEARTIELHDYNVYPTQPPLLDQVTTNQSFIIDSSTYLSDSDYPEKPSVIKDQDIAVIRGHRVLFLKVNPLQYNPVTKTLKVYTTIEVRLNYNHPAQLAGVNNRIKSHAFEELLKASVLNYKDQKRYYMPEDSDGGYEGGCDYLIITHEDFYDKNDPKNPIVLLRNWKTRKGYKTKVVTVDSIDGGNTPEAIQKYIKKGFEKWEMIPTYILIVGDSDLIKPFPGSKHPMENDPISPQPPIETDLYYTTIDGDDYFPDIYIGRLSADTLQQVSDIVNKILAYEQNPPVDPDYYTNISILSDFLDSDSGNSLIDGQEGRPWISNVENVRDFLLSQNYTVERIYVTDSGFPANKNNQAPLQFNDGTPLPNDLLSPNYPWNGDASDITGALNRGRFLICYRGHGNWDSWSGPYFNNTDIAAINQNGLTPVIFSIACQTGWFDNETDDDSKGGNTNSDECFAETFIRQPQSGAMAITAMTRNSYTGTNDFIMFGKFKAIWPDFIPAPHWQGHKDIPDIAPVSLLRMGQILNFGKMFMSKAYYLDDKCKIEFEMEHLFGDPEMAIWTQAPGDLRVEHSKGIGAKGVQEFIITVTDADTHLPVENANVVLTRDNVIVNMQQSNTGGQAHFKLENVGSGDLDVTVTSLYYRPYMGVIAIKAGDAVINILNPTDGPEGQSFHIGGQGFSGGENIDIYFGDQLQSTVQADPYGQFGQGYPTIDILVPMGYSHGLVNITAHGQTSDLFAARVFQVRGKNPIDLWTYSQWDSSTWGLYKGDNPTWDSPDIQLYDKNGSAVGSNNLIFGETYTVKFTVRNSSNFLAHQAHIVFRWTNYGAGGPWDVLDTQVQDISPGTNQVQTIFAPPATGHICLNGQIEHPEDTTPNNNQGQENLHVGYTSSPGSVCFNVWNCTKEPAPVHLEVRQLIDYKEPQRLWASLIKHPDPQILQPGERAQACITVDPDVADVPSGSIAKFAVTAFIGTQMIGGVNVIMIKK